MDKKHRIINWLSIFLLVINISAFATLLFMNNETKSKDLDEIEYFKSDIFLKKALDLSDEQYEKVKTMDYKIFRIYQNILDMQCASNFKLMEQLSSENPDQHTMDSIARQIGNLHMGLKRQTIKHFINIKSICTDEQALLLNQVIKDMMELENQCKDCNKEYCSRRESLYD